MQSESRLGKLLLRELEWDSQHFELSVAEILNPDLGYLELEKTLIEARSRGYQLIYWETPRVYRNESKVLKRYQGQLVDRKACFKKHFTSADRVYVRKTDDYQISLLSPQPSSSKLEKLAIEAGIHSRFGRDSRIPKDKFEELYRIWIQRSTLGEIADFVLIISDVKQNICGFVTATIKDSVGKIGLIAVDSGHRGKGLASMLLRATHANMIERGAMSTEVITQENNIPACALYIAAGYDLVELTSRYHFWPSDVSSIRTHLTVP